ncbi:hypothetical protein [Croceibacter atlanticus]
MNTRKLPRFIRIFRIMLIDLWRLMFPYGVDESQDIRRNQSKPSK